MKNSDVTRLLIMVLLLLPFGLLAEDRSYPYLVVDDPAQLFTMKQFDQNYLSGYRSGVRWLDENLSEFNSTLLQCGLVGFLFAPLTHEEGHRSVLTTEGIGSISQPFFDEDGVARVVGILDLELQGLRDRNLPAFIRLHTAGLESDAALLNRSATLAAFDQEDVDVLWIEYAIRQLSLVSYYSLGLFEYKVRIDEESDELDRDIVGHDVYGAIHHLHRPSADFFRYTEYDDLTHEERQFVKRVGSRALINLINPLLFKRANWQMTDETKWSFGLGYGMCPFGDYFEENAWFLHGKDLRIHVYLREFENEEDWFFGGGVKIADYPVSAHVRCTLALHAWDQPEDLEFSESDGEAGGAADVYLRYLLSAPDHDPDKTMWSVGLGVLTKSDGFMPEEAYMDDRTSLRLGCTVSY